MTDKECMESKAIVKRVQWRDDVREDSEHPQGFGQGEKGRTLPILQMSIARSDVSPTSARPACFARDWMIASSSLMFAPSTARARVALLVSWCFEADCRGSRCFDTKAITWKVATMTIGGLLLLNWMFKGGRCWAGGSTGHGVDIDSIDSFPSTNFHPKVPTTMAFFGVEDTVKAIEWVDTGLLFAIGAIAALAGLNFIGTAVGIGGSIKA